MWVAIKDKDDKQTLKLLQKMTNKKYNTVEKSVTISLEKLSIYVRDVTNESH